MAINSNWAYLNGKRMMAEAKTNQKNGIPEFDFIEDREGNLEYAERRKDDRGRYYLCIKGYANRTQANRLAERLSGQGYNVTISHEHPFKIILI